MFSSTDDLLASNDVESVVIEPIITSHLTNLMKNCQKYFLPELDNVKLDWIQSPFIMSNQSIDHLSLNFQKKKLSIFGLVFVLSDLAVIVLLPFVSRYLCEHVF